MDVNSSYFGLSALKDNIYYKTKTIYYIAFWKTLKFNHLLVFTIFIILEIQRQQPAEEIPIKLITQGQCSKFYLMMALKLSSLFYSWHGVKIFI